MEKCAYHPKEDAVGKCKKCGRPYCANEHESSTDLFCKLCYLRKQSNHNDAALGFFFTIISISFLFWSFGNKNPMFIGLAFAFLVTGIFVFSIRSSKRAEVNYKRRMYIDSLDADIWEKFGFGSKIKIPEYKNIEFEEILEQNSLYTTLIIKREEIELLHCCYQAARLQDKICACGRVVPQKVINHLRN